MNTLFAGVEHAEKYCSANPISRYLVNNFLSSILNQVRACGGQTLHEVGCGEGHITALLAMEGHEIRGSDISEEALLIARAELKRINVVAPLIQKSIYDLDPISDGADVVICCEVLEHLTDPQFALKQLLRCTRKELIISVPHEPIWHILNIARLQYLNALGNTPGHYNHWTKSGFIKFVGAEAKIMEVRNPLPWTIIRCQPRH